MESDHDSSMIGDEADHDLVEEVILLPSTLLPRWDLYDEVGPDSELMDVVYRMILSLMTGDDDENYMLHMLREITEDFTKKRLQSFCCYEHGNLPGSIIKSFVDFAGEEMVAEIYYDVLESLHYATSPVLEDQAQPVIASLEATTTTNADSPMSRLSRFDDSCLLKCILSFVGNNQYRFVALINKEFQNVYLQLFPGNKSTYDNASTVEHAKICIAECRRIRSLRNATLCNSAVRHGDVSTLLYLRSIRFPWDQSTCSAAAKCNRLALLQLLHECGCPWDKTTCEFAAVNGHVEVLQWARAKKMPMGFLDMCSCCI
jgi:hypothetical protein